MKQEAIINPSQKEVADPKVLEAKLKGHKRLVKAIFEKEARVDNPNKLFEATEELMASLEPREARVPNERFGLNGRGIRTLQEVGQDLPRRRPAENGRIVGVNRERVRQIQNRALRRLKHPLRHRRLAEVAGLVRIPQE